MSDNNQEDNQIEKEKEGEDGEESKESEEEEVKEEDFTKPKRKKEDYPLRVIPEPKSEPEPETQPQPQPPAQPKAKRGSKKRVKIRSGDLMKLRLMLKVKRIQSFSQDVK
jgi:hypothetical protein